MKILLFVLQEYFESTESTAAYIGNYLLTKSVSKALLKFHYCELAKKRCLMKDYVESAQCFLTYGKY